MNPDKKVQVLASLWKSELPNAEHFVDKYDCAEFESMLGTLSLQSEDMDQEDVDRMIGEFFTLGRASKAKPFFISLEASFLKVVKKDESVLMEEHSDSMTVRRSRRVTSKTVSLENVRSRKNIRRGRSLKRSDPAEEDEAVPMIVRRTPHIDFEADQPVALSSTFRVFVYADEQAAQDGEVVQEIALPIEKAEVNVSLLVSSHMKLTGITSGTLEINREETSTERLEFEVTVKSEDELQDIAQALPHPNRGSIMAVFSFEGRPCGKVSRIITIDYQHDSAKGVKQDEDTSQIDQSKEGGALCIEPGAISADITVEIYAAQANDGRQFLCRVSSTIPGYQMVGEFEEWNLPDVASKIVLRHMAKLIDMENDRLDALVGAGINFFDAAPEAFKRLYWKLDEAGEGASTMAIISEEPYIPWELMVPNRRHENENIVKEPLGVKFAIGRWLPKDGVSPIQSLSLVDSVIIAPRYQGSDELKYAQVEANVVNKAFPGTIIEPATPKRIKETLQNQKATILHLCCHGRDNTDPGPDGELSQKVILENGELDSSLVRANEGFRSFFDKSNPMVFLNACEIGRLNLALVGVGGFAKAFIDLGAGAVVSALWSVEDYIAHEIAVDFYETIKKDPSLSFAEFFRKIREKAYDKNTETKDTYAAYCFYGDPLAASSPTESRIAR